MISKRRLLFIFIAFSITAPSASAAECTSKSSATIVPLLELYTSEGCSSCPPADQWLSSINNNAGQLTPLAFHVDYWNYLGWKDRFSNAGYTARQHKIASTNHLSFVYTPQFVLNGRDFQHWNDAQLRHNMEAYQKMPSRADLGLHIINQTNGGITLEASASNISPADSRNSAVFIALYENGLSSKINGGENSGRELKHGYVVRELFGAYQLNQQNGFAKNFVLNAEWKKRDAGAVIFVQNTNSGDILQSLTLKFCS